MNYEYDVFLSYARKGAFGDWVRETFLPLFEDYLEASLARTPRIFYDHEAIRGGDQLNPIIQQKLAHSRCLVAMWSPIYFNSPYCKAECAMMLHRERNHGYRTIANPHGLVIPVKLHDGEHYPTDVEGILYLDCKRYFRVGPGFKLTQEYISFQGELLSWCDDVAAVVEQAPEWHTQWLEADWINAALQAFPLKPIIKFLPPTLG